jgi:predicted Fe-Mo cluster-binding NifX family protein
MKIAVVTEDGATISQHFGRAPLYLVVTVEDGRIVSKETRTKTGHHTFAGDEHAHTTVECHHGYGSGSQLRHASMAETIADCQVLIAGGMGWGAYENLKSRNIQTVVTDTRNIEEAVKLYLEGKLSNLTERLH